jgi:hypothetical protein
MRIGEAESIAGTLGNPSKMPGYSTSTSASQCKLGSQLRNVKGSVCEGCYAMGANYRYPSGKIAHERRLKGLSHPLWVEAMVTLLEARVGPQDPYFRWHDSGDLQGVWHLRNICEVARQTPQIRHWLPPREKGMVKAYLRGGGVIPGNLVVRISAAMVNGKPPRVCGPLALATSTVTTSGLGVGHSCPAPQHCNTCSSCRACWNREVENVNYKKH